MPRLLKPRLLLRTIEGRRQQRRLTIFAARPCSRQLPPGRKLDSSCLAGWRIRCLFSKQQSTNKHNAARDGYLHRIGGAREAGLCVLSRRLVSVQGRSAVEVKLEWCGGVGSGATTISRPRGRATQSIIGVFYIREAGCNSWCEVALGNQRVEHGPLL